MLHIAYPFRFGILFITLLFLLASGGEQEDGGVQSFLRPWSLNLSVALASMQPLGPDRPPPTPPQAASLPTPPPPPPAFIWPAAGPVTNVMEPTHPLGLDIGLAAAPNTPIRATAGGRVVFTGGHPCCSYGLNVVVEHEGGLQTKYAHLSRIDVAVGQTVAQAQPLGIAGDTGKSTAVHQHLEFLRGPERLDPLDFLTPPCPYRGILYDLWTPALQGGCDHVPHVNPPEPAG